MRVDKQGTTVAEPATKIYTKQRIVSFSFLVNCSQLSQVACRKVLFSAGCPESAMLTLPRELRLPHVILLSV